MTDARARKQEIWIQCQEGELLNMAHVVQLKVFPPSSKGQAKLSAQIAGLDQWVTVSEGSPSEVDQHLANLKSEIAEAGGRIV